MFRRSVLHFDLESASCFSKFLGVSFRSMSEKGECPECGPAWGQTETPNSDLQASSELLSLSLCAIFSGGSPRRGRTQGPGKAVLRRAHRRSSLEIFGAWEDLELEARPLGFRSCQLHFVLRRFSTTTHPGMVSSFSLIRRVGLGFECMHVSFFGACTCMRLLPWTVCSPFISCASLSLSRSNCGFFVSCIDVHIDSCSYPTVFECGQLEVLGHGRRLWLCIVCGEGQGRWVAESPQPAPHREDLLHGRSDPSTTFNSEASPTKLD